MIYQECTKQVKPNNFAALLSNVSKVAIIASICLIPLSAEAAKFKKKKAASFTTQAVSQSEAAAPILDGNIALVTVSCDETGTGNFKCGTGATNGAATYSTAVGNNAAAQGIEGTAIGHISQAFGNFSLAAGNNALAQGYASSAIGVSSRAVGNGDIAMGGQADTFKTGTQTHGNIAIGSSSGIVNGGSLGTFTIANGGNTVAMGTGAQATGSNSNTIGAFSTAAGLQATAFGGFANASQTSTVAVGYSARATGLQSVAIGDSSLASGVASLAIGQASTASADGTTVFGQFAIANSAFGSSFGSGSKANGQYSTSLGAYSEATGFLSSAFGSQAKATGSSSVAIGFGSLDGGLANVVSFGHATLARRLINVANGTVAPASKDAVNGAQLYALCVQVAGCSAFNLTNAASGTETLANNNSAQAAATNTVYSPTQTVVREIAYTPSASPSATPSATDPEIIALQSLTSSQGAAISSLNSRFSNLNDLVAKNQIEARGGIAALAAMGRAPMPSAVGKTSYTVDFGMFHEETGIGASIAHRFDTKTPFALTAGVSSSGSETIGRIGIAGEF